jgi:hypothetical protein
MQNGVIAWNPNRGRIAYALPNQSRDAGAELAVSPSLTIVETIAQVEPSEFFHQSTIMCQ